MCLSELSSIFISIGNQKTLLTNIYIFIYDLRVKKGDREMKLFYFSLLHQERFEETSVEKIFITKVDKDSRSGPILINNLLIRLQI